MEEYCHMLTKAVEWGYIPKHPFKGEVRFKQEKSRSRYVKDWEVQECFKLKALPYCKTLFMQAYMAFAIVSGLRKQDALQLKASDIKEDGIHVTTRKTGKSIIIEWTPTLRFVTQQLLDQRPVDISPYLICNRQGEAYYRDGSSSGFDSVFQRFIKRAIAETALEEKFTLHDLRAKCASDIKSDEDAQKLLAHSSIQTTRKAYRRKAEVVRPLR